MKEKISGNSQKVLRENPWLWAVNSSGWTEIELKVSRVDYVKLPTHLVFKPGNYLSVWVLFVNEDTPDQFDHRVLCVCEKTTENDPIKWVEIIMSAIDRNAQDWKIKSIAIEVGVDSKTISDDIRSRITVCKPKKGLKFEQILVPVIENTDSCVSKALAAC